MYIQYYNKENGRPSLFEKGSDIPDNFIKDAPPGNLYDPIQYSDDLGRWIGPESPSIIEEPETPEIPEDNKIDETEEALAQIILENTLMQFSMKKTSDRVQVLESLVDEIKSKEEDNTEEDTNGDTLPEI